MAQLELGAYRRLAQGPMGRLTLPPHHLLTHGVVVGMTGSGKTGLLFVLVEEALRSGVPVLMVDLKGDLPNLALSFSDFGPEPMRPWAESLRLPTDPRSAEQVAAELADTRRRGLTAWGVTEQHVRSYNAATEVRILTPGSTAGEPVHLLSALERPAAAWKAAGNGAAWKAGGDGVARRAAGHGVAWKEGERGNTAALPAATGQAPDESAPSSP